MKTYAFHAAYSKGVRSDALHDWFNIKDFLNRLPERSGTENPDPYETGHFWSCHGLTRASLLAGLGLRLTWTVVDGFFHKIGTEHSWLHFQSGRNDYVMDLYPIAQLNLGPNLLDVTALSPQGQLYLPDDAYFVNQQEGFKSEAHHILTAYNTIRKTPA